MALRVLLADESSSIKRVMQLALQDFGVEVKAVPVGLDVVSVAKSWGPDIIFVDTLLVKMSGYDVSSQLKADAELKNIPVVLMWSSFIDVDEAKARSSGADRRLEKPFDADTLRGIVKDLVPSTQDNAIANYLSFPHLPDFVEKQEAPPARLTGSTVGTTSSYSNMNSDALPTLGDMDEPEDFSQVPLPRLQQETHGGTNHDTSEPWAADNLDRFKIQLPKEDYGNFEESYGNIEDAPITMAGENASNRELHMGDLDDLTPAKQPTSAKASTSFGPANTQMLDPAVVEQVLREQVRAVLQEIAWKVIPDVGERILREEIQKLLKDAEKLS